MDKCDLLDKDKVWCIYFELIPKLSWPMQIYEVSFTKVKTMERLISKYTKKWLGVLLLNKCGTIQFINDAKTSDVITG